MLIYKVLNKINNKIYIGQTTKTLEKRKSVHYSALRYGVNYNFYKGLRKHLPESFEWSVLCEVSSLKELNEMEIYYISLYDSTNPKKGYNMTGGGFTSPMINPTREVIDKMKKSCTESALYGENNPMKRPEVIEKHKQSVNDPERCKRHSEWMKNNYRHTEEEKIRRCKYKVVLQLPCGEVITITNLKTWCKENNVGYSALGKRIKDGGKKYGKYTILEGVYFQ